MSPPRSLSRKVSALVPGDREVCLAKEVLRLHSIHCRDPAASARRKSKRQRVSSAAAAAAPLPPPASPGALAQREALRAAADVLSNRGSSPSDDKDDVDCLRGPPAPAQIQSCSARRESNKRNSATAAAKPLPPSPGALAQREALRAAVDVFSNRGSSPSDDKSAGFITSLFKKDAALRRHYERGREEGQFACLACAGGTRKAGRRFRGCIALVQHARSATRYGRLRAHRALAAAVSGLFDPRCTL
ncbi:hypothetical protein BAE44_0003711, partial [Dichanthelium oligosanthes]